MNLQDLYRLSEGLKKTESKILELMKSASKFLKKENNLSDVENRQTSLNNLTGSGSNNQILTYIDGNAQWNTFSFTAFEITTDHTSITSPRTDRIYLEGPKQTTPDAYEEWIYTTSWIMIGETTIDLSGKVSKTGDTMTGDLNMNTNNLIFTSATSGYGSKIYNDTSGLNLLTTANGSTFALALKLFNSQDKAIFRRNNIYTGSTEDEDHRLMDGADVDGKLAGYLPLTNTTLKTITNSNVILLNLKRAAGGGAFVTIFANNQDTIGWRFGSDSGNNFQMSSSDDGMSTTTQRLKLFRDGNLVSSGSMYVQGTDTSNAKKVATVVPTNSSTVTATTTLQTNANEKYLIIVSSLSANATLTITPVAGTSGIENEYSGVITVGSISNTLTLAFDTTNIGTVSWYDVYTTLSANKKYEYSILDGVGVMVEI